MSEEVQVRDLMVKATLQCENLDKITQMTADKERATLQNAVRERCIKCFNPLAVWSGRYPDRGG